MLKETFMLNNGVKIPKLGLGTWFIEDDKAADAVREAVKLVSSDQTRHRHMETSVA